MRGLRADWPELMVRLEEDLFEALEGSRMWLAGPRH